MGRAESLQRDPTIRFGVLRRRGDVTLRYDVRGGVSSPLSTVDARRGVHHGLGQG
jgi:hypothetical protein